MLSIRLSRKGSKNRPFYHIAVAESSKKRDGAFVEHIGFFNPFASGKAEAIRFDLERFDYWVSVGAQPSDRVKSLVKKVRNLQTAS